MPYWTVSDANFPLGGEELRIVERIVISQIVPSQLIQDQDDSVLVKLVWVLEIDLEYSILDLAGRHLVTGVVGCDCAIHVLKWILIAAHALVLKIGDEVRFIERWATGGVV